MRNPYSRQVLEKRDRARCPYPWKKGVLASSESYVAQITKADSANLRRIASNSA
jgi:hypothetical protein